MNTFPNLRERHAGSYSKSAGAILWNVMYSVSISTFSWDIGDFGKSLFLGGKWKIKFKYFYIEYIKIKFLKFFIYIFNRWF